MLDMGEPVRIVELARAMIELSGLDPDHDIDIEIVGRRPGRSSTRSCSTATSIRGRRSPRRSCSPSARRSRSRRWSRCSRRSACSCSRATRRGWRRRSPSSPPRVSRTQSNGTGEVSRGAMACARCACAPHTLPGFMTLSLLALLAFELVHQDRSHRGVRCAVRDRRAVAAVLLSGARAEATARVGRPRPRARRRSRAARERRGRRARSAARARCSPGPSRRPDQRARGAPRAATHVARRPRPRSGVPRRLARPAGGPAAGARPGAGSGRPPPPARSRRRRVRLPALRPSAASPAARAGGRAQPSSGRSAARRSRRSAPGHRRPRLQPRPPTLGEPPDSTAR